MAGFKIATGYVEVEVLYDKNKLRKAASEAGEDAGSSFSSSFLNKKSFTSIVEKGMKNAGKKASDSFSDSFSEGMEKGQKGALKFVPTFAKNFADQFNKSLPKQLQATSRQFEKSFRDSYHKGMPSLGKDAAKAYVKAVNKEISRSDVRYTNINAVKRLAIEAGNTFAEDYHDRVRARFVSDGKRVFDDASKAMDPVLQKYGLRSAHSVVGGFRTEFKKRLVSEVGRTWEDLAKNSQSVTHSFSTLGGEAGKGFTGTLKQHLEKDGSRALDLTIQRYDTSLRSKMPFLGNRAALLFSMGWKNSSAALKTATETTMRSMSVEVDKKGPGIGSRLGRAFMSAFSGTVSVAGSSFMDSFGKMMKTNVHLNVAGMVAIIAGVALLMPAIGAGIAGALTLGFAGGLAALGVVAWKESEKVKTAFSEMSNFIVSDFKRVSAPMESVLVQLATDVREAYESLSPSLETFFATTEPAFKSFQRDILDGFAAWGPAIERSGWAFDRLAEHLGPAMQDKIAELGAAFEEMFKAVGENPEAVTAVFKGLMNILIGIIKTITWLTETWSAMRVAWEEDTAGIRSIVQGLGSVIDGVFGAIVGMIRGSVVGIWELFSGLISGIKMMFQGDFLGGLYRIFEGLFRGIGTFLAGIVEGVAHFISKLFQIFGVDTSTWVTNTMNFLYTTWNTVLNFFQGLPAVIGGFFSGLWEGIKNTFNGFISWVTNFGATIINAITWPFREVYRIIVGNSIIPDLVNAVLGWIQNMLNWIMVPLNAIKNFFVTVFTSIYNTVSGIVRNTVNGVVGIFQSMGSGIRAAVSAVVNWVRTTFSNWVGWIYDKFNALRTNTINIWGSLTNGIRSVVSAVVRWVQTTFNNWVGWIYEKFNALRTNGSNIWNAFTRAIRSIVSAVVKWVQTTFNNWVGWIYDKFNALRTNGSNIWNSLTRAIRSIVSAVVKWVQTTFNNWIGWIYDKFNALRTNGSNIWNAFTRSIRNIVNAVVRWVQNTFNRWIGWIYDKFNALRTNGSNIWNSLTRAIRSIVGAVVRWVQNALTRWVGWIYDKFNALRTNSINIWERIRKGIVDKVTAFRDRAMRVVNGFKDGVIEAFEKAKKGVETAWDKVRKAASAPVKFMVNTVYEKGIRVLWSKIADHVPGLGYLKKVTLPRGFAKGGVMPGYTPGRDVHTVPGPGGAPIGLSGGEAIMRPEWTRAIGADAVHAMNKVARTKGVAGLRAAMAAGPGFATGGVAGSAKSGNSRTKDLGTSRAMPMGPTNPLKTPTGKLARGWNTGHQGFADGGVLGWVKDKVDSVKDFASDVMGNIVGWATKPFTKAFDMLKDKANGGSTKKNFPGVPYHAGQHMWGKIKELFQSKDDEYNAQFDDGLGGFGSFTYNGKPADLPGLRGTKPHVRMIGNFIASMFKVGTAYGLGGPPEHSTGRAIDYMVGTGKGQSRGDGISSYYIKHKDPLALKWVIWRQRIYNTARKSWRKMEDRGNPTQNHFDHPHVFHQTSAPKARDFIGKQKGVKFSGGGGGAGGGSGNTMMTSFWDSHARMANGKRMHGSAVASSVIPLGTKIRVKVGGKTANGSIDDLGPASFVYRRHHPKALLDLAEPMMSKLTGRRSNTVMGSFNVTKRGSGRTLFGYTRWNGVYDPKRSTRGFDTGGIIGGTPMGHGTHDVGGLLPDRGIAHNRSGEAEVVQTLDQLKAILAAAQGGGDTIIIEKICIDAKNVKEFNDIIKMMNDVRKTGRSNGGNVGFKIRE